MSCHHASFFLTLQYHLIIPRLLNSQASFRLPTLIVGINTLQLTCFTHDGLAHCSQSDLFGSTHYFHLARTLARLERPRAPLVVYHHYNESRAHLQQTRNACNSTFSKSPLPLRIGPSCPYALLPLIFHRRAHLHSVRRVEQGKMGNSQALHLRSPARRHREHQLSQRDSVLATSQVQCSAVPAREKRSRHLPPAARQTCTAWTASSGSPRAVCGESADILFYWRDPPRKPGFLKLYTPRCGQAVRCETGFDVLDAGDLLGDRATSPLSV
jgi:hypothetical protein